jgi:hypothetical protein
VFSVTFDQIAIQRTDTDADPIGRGTVAAIGPGRVQPTGCPTGAPWGMLVPAHNRTNGNPTEGIAVGDDVLYRKAGASMVGFKGTQYAVIYPEGIIGIVPPS